MTRSHFEARRSSQVEKARLEQHVIALAGEIGERNVFRPKALATAADYIQGSWEGQGYEVARQVYQVEGVACANLEVSRSGGRKSDVVLLIGSQ